ncbi:MAG: B12-binding domain-containing protein [Candidatus Bathyarchaeia archaeon]|jgi:dimethylamine corrinoid protein
MSEKANALEQISRAVQGYDETAIFSAVKAGLSMNIEPGEIIEKGIAKGLRIVGEKFERGEMFLVDLISAAEPAQKAVREILEPEFKKTKGMKTLGQVVIGTVHGDIHNIGKNIVSSMFFAAGFQVLDLGEDVPAEKFTSTASESKAAIVGASALLTTTIEGQKEIVESLKASGLRDKVKTMFGGAPCTPEWVRQIGGDAYAMNAMEAVKVAKQLLNIKE